MAYATMLQVLGVAPVASILLLPICPTLQMVVHPMQSQLHGRIPSLSHSVTHSLSHMHTHNTQNDIENISSSQTYRVILLHLLLYDLMCAILRKYGT